MALEDVGTVEALFRCGSWAWTETANHSTLVVGKSVSVFVIFPCKSLDVVFAGCDRALLWSLILVSEHVCLQILENTSAFWDRAKTLLSTLVVKVIAASAFPTSLGMMRMYRSIRLSSWTIEVWIWLEGLCMKIGRLATPLELPWASAVLAMGRGIWWSRGRRLLDKWEAWGWCGLNVRIGRVGERDGSREWLNKSWVYRRTR